MTGLYFILALLAAVCFGAAALGWVAKRNLVALGLLLWVLIIVIQYGRAVL